jgi:hypothetical protein
MAQEAITHGEIELALDFYNRIIAACEKIALFTVEKHRKTLKEANKIALDMLYPRIEALLRDKTAHKAKEVLKKLSSAVEGLDREKARQLNKKLLDIVAKALRSKDELLLKRIKSVDKNRADIFRTVEVLDKFDKEVKPRLALRGTITGKLACGQPFAFMDIRTSEGTHSVVLGESDKIDIIQELRVVEISNDYILLRYHGVEIRLELGAQVVATSPATLLRAP